MNTATHGVREPLGALQIIIPATFKSDMNDSTPTPSRLLRLYAALAQWIFWVVLAVSLLLLAGWGALHGWIVPRIGEFRPQIEAQATRPFGVAVRIGEISARSEGLIPSIELLDVALLDGENRAALRLPRVVVSLSPRSLLRFGFEQIYIEGPELDMRRERDGRIVIAGLAFRDSAEGDSAAADWLFSQREVVVRRFGLRGHESCTLEEVGQEIGLTRERVRQIKEKAIRRLRHTSRSKALKPYLG